MTKIDKVGGFRTSDITGALDMNLGSTAGQSGDTTTAEAGEPIFDPRNDL